MKRFIEGSIDRTTWYIRDAFGNIISIITEASEALTWESAPIYGSSRVGSYEPGLLLGQTGGGSGPGILTSCYRCKVVYELSNHLGNVLATITDRKIWITANDPETWQYYVRDAQGNVLAVYKWDEDLCPRLVFFTNLSKVSEMFRIMRYKTPFINIWQIIFCRRILVIFRNVGQCTYKGIPFQNRCCEKFDMVFIHNCKCSIRYLRKEKVGEKHQPWAKNTYGCKLARAFGNLKHF
jgi:hypothetical protein